MNFISRFIARAIDRQVDRSVERLQLKAARIEYASEWRYGLTGRAGKSVPSSSREAAVDAAHG